DAGNDAGGQPAEGRLNQRIGLRRGTCAARARQQADHCQEQDKAGDRRTGVAQQVAQQVGTGHGEADQCQEDQDDGKRDATAYTAPDLASHQTFSSVSTSPKMPEGRKISTSTRMEKAMTSLSWNGSPSSAGPTASTRPRNRPPIIAPGMFPMPPSTAAVNAFRPGRNPT